MTTHKPRRPKPPSAVEAARAALEAKQQQVADAKQVVRQLEGELSLAYQAVHTAQLEADAALPQCRVAVISHYRTGETMHAVPMVILRKTPGGALVVRPAGSAAAEEKFRWSAHRACYAEVKRSGTFCSTHRELRDVPSAYLPADHKEAL